MPVASTIMRAQPGGGSGSGTGGNNNRETTPPPAGGKGGGTPVGVPAQPTVMTGTAPAEIQEFGATPTVSATYANAAQVDPNSINAEKSATVDPNQNQVYLTEYESAVQNALAPQEAQQNEQLAEQDAARGITDSGSAAYLSGNLQGQQIGAYSSAIEPLIGEEAQNTQSDIVANQANQETAYNNQYQGYLNSVFSDQADTQQANLANASASNTANSENAAAYASDRNANFNAYNGYVSQMLDSGSQEQNELLEAELGSYGPNAGVGSMYGTEESGTNNAYTDVFDQATQSQGQAIGSAFGAAGTYFGDAAGGAAAAGA
jgi:hypothetical protein